MPSESFSPAQQEALAFPANLLIHAAAGSGKTGTLVELFVRLLLGEVEGLPPLDPPQLAAITFTNAAAVEMAARTRESLLKRRAEGRADPDRIATLLRQMHRLSIGTIHSLGRRLLAAHPIEGGLDPDSRRIEPEEMAQRSHAFGLERVLQDWPTLGELERRCFLALDLGPGRADRSHTLLDLLEAIRGQARRTDRTLADWAALHREASAEAVAASVPSMEEVWTALRALTAEAVAKSSATKKASEFLEKYGDWELRLTDRVDAAAKLGDPGWLAEWLVGLRKSARAAGVAAKATQQNAEKLLKRWEEALREQVIQPALQRMLGWAGAIEERLEAWKRSAGAHEYDDEIRMALRLIVEHPTVLQEWQRRLAVIFVDEFQDTDPLQIALVMRLLGPIDGADPITRRLVAVGDRRQAIYRFRGADVRSFTEFHAAWKGDGSPPSRKVVELPANFRSHPRLLAFINAFMRHAAAELKAPEATGLAHPMEPGRREAEAGAARAHWILPAPVAPSSDEAEGGDAADHNRLEAEAVARSIRKLLETGTRPGEIALLFRTRTHQPVYEAALAHHRIPYRLYKGRGFYQSQEVSDAFNAWSALIRPGDALAVASLLRSPMVGLDDDTLFSCAVAPNPLHDRRWISESGRALLIERATEASRPRLKRLYEWLLPLLARRDRLGPAALIERVIDDTDFMAVLLTDPSGPQRVANLKKLIEAARAWEAGGGTAAGWIDELERRRREDAEESAAPLQEAGGEAMTVSTIHAAKGLEWPHVFVTGLDKLPQSETSPLQFHPVRGFALQAPGGGEERRFGDTALSRRVREDNDLWDRSEPLRLLYVAITRAREYLYLSGAAGSKRNGAWMRLLESFAATPEAEGLLEKHEIGGEAFQREPVADPWPTLDQALTALRSDPRTALGSDPPPERRLNASFSLSLPREVAVSVGLLARWLFCPRYMAFERSEDREAGIPGESEAPLDRLALQSSLLGPLESGRILHAMLETADSRHTPESRRAAMRRQGLHHLELPESALSSLEIERLDDLADRAARWFEANALSWIGRGERLRREWPFLLLRPVSGGRLLLRGVIDLWSERDGRPARLIDFKWAVPRQPADTLHANQLRLYAAALGELEGGVPDDIRLEYLAQSPHTERLEAMGDWLALQPELEALADCLRASPAVSPDRLPGHPQPECERRHCPRIGLCHAPFPAPPVSPDPF